jgi:hypothetical protein
MEPSARMKHARLSLIWFLFIGNSRKNGKRYILLVKDKWYREVNFKLGLWKGSRKCWCKRDKVLGLKILFLFSTEWQKSYPYQLIVLLDIVIINLKVLIFLQYKKVNTFVFVYCKHFWNKMELMDVYVFSLWFHGLLYFSWMEPSARLIQARVVSSIPRHERGSNTFFHEIWIRNFHYQMWS